MSESKKYESFGVDRDQQAAKPTLIEKVQQEENESKKHVSLASPEQIEAANSKTHYGDRVNTLSTKFVIDDAKEAK